ncbi:hypothetical protein, partial [Thiorhodovibrio winogradskyi]|uniref:hypothetical protein n=1 Tax=Thiorhodovibrio winogradskyi TaxID=77007 RepID=UPI001A917E36
MASDNLQLQLAQAFVRDTNRSIFLTGKAGTGKTTFLHSLNPYLTTGHRIILIFSRISVHRCPLWHYICDFAAGAAHSDQSQLLSTRAITHAQGIVNGLLARLRPCG